MACCQASLDCTDTWPQSWYQTTWSNKITTEIGQVLLSAESTPPVPSWIHGSQFSRAVASGFTCGSWVVKWILMASPFIFLSMSCWGGITKERPDLPYLGGRRKKKFCPLDVYRSGSSKQDEKISILTDKTCSMQYLAAYAFWNHLFCLCVGLRYFPLRSLPVFNTSCPWIRTHFCNLL